VAGYDTIIRNIIVCNPTGIQRAYRIFHDAGGNTYDTTTALYYDQKINANTTYAINSFITMNNSVSNLALTANLANSLCVTVSGSEIKSTDQILHNQLGQVAPSVAMLYSLYSPAANKSAVIKTIAVCNYSAGPTTFRIFLDNDGTTYNDSTCLYNDIPIAKKTTELIDIHQCMDNSSGNLAVYVPDINTLTFTAYGIEITNG